jgi:DNA-binding transcriptional ArsR family regulator
MFHKTDTDSISCDAYNDDPTRVRRVAKAMPPDKAIEAAARLLRGASDPVRVRILYALTHERLCVCELATLLGMTMPAVSHHLRVLSLSNLVSVSKQGKFACYSVRDEHLTGVLGSLFENLKQSIGEAA